MAELTFEEDGDFVYAMVNGDEQVATLTKDYAGKWRLSYCYSKGAEVRQLADELDRRNGEPNTRSTDERVVAFAHEMETRRYRASQRIETDNDPRLDGVAFGRASAGEEAMDEIYRRFPELGERKPPEDWPELFPELFPACKPSEEEVK